MYIKMNNVTKVANGNVILDNINYVFERGKIYGIKGKNGSGKTMILKALCGLVKLSEGEIIINDKKLRNGHDFPDDVSVLIENPGFIGNYSGLKNLKIIAGIRKRISDEHIISLMKRFNLDPYSKKKVKKYSLGMKQKLGIIAAIMESSELILLDEPTNALDIDSVKILNEVILEEKDKGATILITSHDLVELSNVTDCVIEVDNGKIIMSKEKGK